MTANTKTEKIRTIIIDDEDAAISTLRHLLSSSGFAHVEVVSTATSLPDAVIEINKHMPDLVFLDIEMPNYTGLEILKFFKVVDFEIIIVSAYSKYMSRTLALSAIDFIHKPIGLEALKSAVNKSKLLLGKQSIQKRVECLRENLESTTAGGRIAIAMAAGIQFVKLADIVMFKAQGSYTKIFLVNNKNILASKNLKYFRKLVSEERTIIQVHRSSLINIDYIINYSRSQMQVTLHTIDQPVAISRTYKSRLEQGIIGND